MQSWAVDLYIHVPGSARGDVRLPGPGYPQQGREAQVSVHTETTQRVLAGRWLQPQPGGWESMALALSPQFRV